MAFSFSVQIVIKRIFPECGCLAGHSVPLNQSGLACARPAPCLRTSASPSLTHYSMDYEAMKEFFLNRAVWSARTYFCLSNLTMILSLCLKTPTKSHHVPCASVFYVLPSLTRMSQRPSVLPMTVPHVQTLIKRTSGRSKVAPISVPALKFQLGWVQNGHVILFYLLSIIFDGLDSGNKITVHLARESVTFTLCCHISLCTQHIKTQYIISEAKIEKVTKSSCFSGISLL